MEADSARQILVVDDDAVVAEVLQRKLQGAGYGTIVAGTGGDALDRVKAGGVDLVLLDVELPDQSGIETLHQIRESRSAIELPVIMVTGRDAEESELEALGAAANDYVTKPVSFPVLIARIATQLTLKDLHGHVRESHRSLIHAARMESALHLAGGFAREIRGPLARVRSGMNGLAGNVREDDAAASENMKHMTEALREADAVVSRLVASSAESRLKLEPTDVAGFCRDMLRVLEVTALEHGVTLELKAGERLPAAMVSSRELSQVFLNVGLNAIRAGGKGSKIVVRVLEQRLPAQVETEGNRMGGRLHRGDKAVVIEVEDSGPGLTEVELQRVYDPFFKGGCAGTGPGLGLTLAKSLAELHGGAFVVENKAFGSGAKASIYLRPKPELRV